MAALKIGKISEKINFDWENTTQVSEKVVEEWKELQVEIQTKGTEHDPEKIEEELGDFLFTVVQLARHLKLDPELALIKANNKFTQRFRKIEEYLEEEQKNIHTLSTKELDRYWNRAKGEVRKC